MKYKVRRIETLKNGTNTRINDLELEENETIEEYLDSELEEYYDDPGGVIELVVEILDENNNVIASTWGYWRNTL